MKKIIIFRVIGEKKVGLGHVYRCISLAHEFYNNKIYFVTEKKNNLVKKIVSKSKYKLVVCDKKNLNKKIFSLNPDVVINDMLNTSKINVLPFIEKGISVINFEDLGNGAKYADLVINELYDKPINTLRNTLWGYNYFFVRDEFKNLKPSTFRENINNILLTFGGTDSLSLSEKIYVAIKDICHQNKIKLSIVTGPGYRNYRSLSKKIKNDKNCTLTHDTGVISKIMKKSDLAITSNGRTVYELAHMNVPTIVISQHQRETTHKFTNNKNGFISLGQFKNKITQKKLISNLHKIINQKKLRRTLYSKMQKYNFNNKNKIIHILRGYL
tara:strand:- start:18370 stop:19350 length:981 start_codon:yes stop_codon:yes gene_type:complete